MCPLFTPIIWDYTMNNRNEETEREKNRYKRGLNKKMRLNRKKKSAQTRHSQQSEDMKF